MTPDDFRYAMQIMGLTREQTADALGVKIDTVHGWLTPGGKKGRAINATAAKCMAWAAARGGFPNDWPTT